MKMILNSPLLNITMTVINSLTQINLLFVHEDVLFSDSFVQKYGNSKILDFFLGQSQQMMTYYTGHLNSPWGLHSEYLSFFEDDDDYDYYADEDYVEPVDCNFYSASRSFGWQRKIQRKIKKLISSFDKR